MAEISDIVRITAEVRAGGVARRDFGRTLFLTTDGNIDAGGSGKVRVFATAREVAEVFPSGTEPYDAAQIYFSQVPRPRNFLVGRWATSNVNTILQGGTGHDALATLQAISDGAFVAGGVAFSGIDLSGATDLAGVAAALQTALLASSDARFVSATVAYTAGAFVVTLASRGDIGGPFEAPASGTDLADALALDAAGGADYSAGSDAETVEEALDAIEAIGEDFYFITIEKAYSGAQESLDIASWASARRYSAYMGSAEAGALTPAETTSFAAQMSALETGRVAISFSKRADYLPVSIAGRMSAVNYKQPNGVITAKFKTCPGITASDLSTADRGELDRKRVNYYTQFSGDNIYAEGWTPADGIWMDVQAWLDWLVNALEVGTYNLLKATPRIPQTNSGVAAVRTTLAGVLEEGVLNGGIAPGKVSPGFIQDISTSFGDPDFNGELTSGYLIWVGSLAAQSQTLREGRNFPATKIWMKGAGAVHFVDIALVFEN